MLFFLKRSQMFLIHLKDGMILYGEQYKPLLVFLEYWLLDLRSCERGKLIHSIFNEMIIFSANLNDISHHLTGIYNLIY